MRAVTIDFETFRADLRRTPLLASMADDDLRRIASAFQAVILDGQETVFSQDDDGDAFYIVATGRFEVVRDDAGVRHTLALLGPGSVFGEAALLRGEPRSATVRAARDSRVLRLDADSYHLLARECSDSLLALVRLMVRRMDGAVQPSDTRSGVCAIVPLGDPFLAGHLAEELVAASTVAGFRAIAPERPRDLSAAGAWLGELEVSHRRVLLVTDPTMTPWTRGAVRNADRVLLVADASADPTPGALEQAVRAASPDGRVELVLAARHTDEVGAIAPWARARGEQAITPVRLATADVTHLAAHLPGGGDRHAWLRSSALFADLPDALLAEAAASFEFRKLVAGEVLFEQGDPGDALYVVRAGRLSVGDDAHRVGPGQVVGEMGLFSPDGRTATVRAARDSLVARLDRARYDRLVARQPGLARTLAQIAFERARGSRRFDERPRLAIAVVPLDGSVDFDGFLDDLSAALSHMDDASIVTADKVDAALGAGSAQVRSHAPGDVTLLQWMSQHEERYVYVLYGTEPAASEWTRRCVRQADVVLFVGDATASPVLRPLEADLFPGGAPPGARLLLVHPRDAKHGRGTAAWLDARGLDAVLHVRRAGRRMDTDDLERAARLLTGRAVGLALGGGGSRGVAHLGVYRAFHELGVPIDAVGGTSAGAALSALVAMQLPPDDAVGAITRILSRSTGHFRNMGPMLVSLMSGHHVRDLLVGLAGDLDVEDLFVPMVTAAADVDDGRLVEIGRGPVWEAVRASLSLPAIWPPVIRQGRRLVDGGVLNNLPADLLRRRCRHGAVIASDISTNQGAPEPYAQYPGHALSGWSLLRSWLFGRGARYPTIANIITDTMVLGSLNHLRDTLRRDADLVINPKLTGVGMFDVRDAASVRRGADVGYAEALANLKGWRWQGIVGWHDAPVAHARTIFGGLLR